MHISPGIPEGAPLDHRSHGGRRAEAARAAGVPEESLLDFSANINPLGPPAWLPEAIEEGLRRVVFYPDPDATRAREAAAARYGLDPDSFLFADGADSLIFALPRALAAASVLAAQPSYSGYLRAARRARLPLLSLPLDPERGFSQGEVPFWEALERSLAVAPRPSLLFLGAPNNPVGGSPPPERLMNLARRFPEAYFALDESFAELAGVDRGFIGAGQRNLIVLRSLTKTWAVPGARLGFAVAEPELLALLRAELPAWPLSAFAEAIATRAFRDRDHVAASAAFVAREAAGFSAALGALPGLRVQRSGANFLLLEFASDRRGAAIARGLLGRGIATRGFSAAEGLSGRYLRIAVRTGEENRRFLAALTTLLAEDEEGAWS